MTFFEKKSVGFYVVIQLLKSKYRCIPIWPVLYAI